MYCLLLLLAPSAFGQEPDSLKGEKRFTEYLNTILYEKFFFESPGPDFRFLEDSSGYQYTEKKATIKVLVTIGSFEEVLSDFRKTPGLGNYKLLDSSFFSSPRTGFSRIYEASPPEGVESENFIAVMVLFPFSENVSIGVVGGYPKSTDTLYRKKFLDAALTLRHKDE